MKLRQRLGARKVFVGLYVLAFAVYLIVGLQPAEATRAAVSAELSIPEIGLVSDVATLTLGDNGLETPDKIVGSYSRAKNKTLLIGHSTAAFRDLNQVELDDIVKYDNKNYRVVTIDKVPKTDVDMQELLASAEKDTIVMMTCAGEMFDNNDATHRLIITAASE